MFGAILKWCIVLIIVLAIYSSLSLVPPRQPVLTKDYTKLEIDKIEERGEVFFLDSSKGFYGRLNNQIICLNNALQAMGCATKAKYLLIDKGWSDMIRTELDFERFKHSLGGVRVIFDVNRNYVLHVAGVKKLIMHDYDAETLYRTEVRVKEVGGERGRADLSYCKWHKGMKESIRLNPRAVGEITTVFETKWRGSLREGEIIVGVHYRDLEGGCVERSKQEVTTECTRELRESTCYYTKKFVMEYLEKKGFGGEGKLYYFVVTSDGETRRADEFVTEIRNEGKHRVVYLKNNNVLADMQLLTLADVSLGNPMSTVDWTVRLLRLYRKYESGGESGEVILPMYPDECFRRETRGELDIIDKRGGELPSDRLEIHWWEWKDRKMASYRF